MKETMKWAKLSVAALALVATSSEAFAGAFAIREQSAYYQGLSFAGYGTTGPSISSVFWNPATITGAGDGLTFESHNTVIIPDSEIKQSDYTANPALAGLGVFDSNVNSGDIGNDAFVPSTYAAYKVNEDIFVGLAINAPFGLGTKPENNWAGQFYSRSSSAFSINVNPIAGYRINDQVSIAAGLQVQYLDVSLKRGVPTSLTLGTGILDGDDVGFGATAGITYKPFEGTEFGLGYRSAVSHKLEGDLTVPAVVFPAPTPGSVTPISAKLITPDQVNFSFKQRVNESFRVLGTVEWTNWSRLTEPKVVADANGATIQTLPFNYDDGWFFALGGEYDYNEQLTLRAGLAYEISPIDDDIRSTRLPDSDRIWVSGGLTYNFNHDLSFDLGYTHIFAEDGDIAIVQGHQDYNSGIGSFTGQAESSVDIISASVRYRWGGPTHADEPITTKY
ncbi:outer membrane protein transport protein [Stappia sp. F7233]|uniref:Outer membrane protein transport protein n=1 Tax=Stappia albiluteola TaxID=2758565 RepID=A0A839ADV9_9HYPH|nr:OmpP1/FadL family transporter [Stappia albiluteola]MBA5777731.1 outer membrane protein transport protein [Stappia albiluteola]